MCEGLLKNQENKHEVNSQVNSYLCFKPDRGKNITCKKEWFPRAAGASRVEAGLAPSVRPLRCWQRATTPLTLAMVGWLQLQAALMTDAPQWPSVTWAFNKQLLRHDQRLFTCGWEKMVGWGGTGGGTCLDTVINNKYFSLLNFFDSSTVVRKSRTHT